MSPNTTTWTTILTSGTTSKAIALASVYSPVTLSQIPLPLPYPKLSDGARANLDAVRRALGVRFDDFQSSPWEAWDITHAAAEGSSKIEENIRKRVRVEDVDNVSIGDFPIAIRPTHNKDVPVVPHAEVLVERQEQLKVSGTDKVTIVGEPSAEEVRAAEIVRDWAMHAAHTPAPADSLSVIRGSAHSGALLARIASVDSPGPALAAVVGAFTDDAGPRLADEVSRVILQPFVAKLTVAASREMMVAVVAFVKRHWRATVRMFVWAGSRSKPVNASVVEVLVRAGEALCEEGAIACLEEFCKCPWGEVGVRVVDVLLMQCKARAEVPGILVPALERNVVDLEKSVRFGKLLFSTVKDVPMIREQYAQAFEGVCVRSKGFLAKRALTLLRSKKDGET